MNIIVERPSSDGNFRTIEIKDITRYYKIDRYGEKLSPAIMCHQPNGKKFAIMHFPTSGHCERCLRDIKHASSNVVVLDLNKYFRYELRSNEQVLHHMAKQDLLGHMKSVLTIMCTRDKLNLVHLLEKDAFKTLNLGTLNLILSKKYIIFEESLADRWSKTLPIPKHTYNWGITPQQFFQKLITIYNERANI